MIYTNDEIRKAINFCRSYIRRKPFRLATVTVSEWLFLYNLVKESKPSRIIEIGCYLYTSTLAFLKAMDECLPSTVLYSLDPIHNRGPGNFWYKNEDVNSRWFRVITESQNFMQHLDGDFDMIWIDGDHTKKGMQSDFENALRLIAPGGHIIVHDVCHPSLKGHLLEMKSEDEFEWHTEHMKGRRCKGLAIYRA